MDIVCCTNFLQHLLLFFCWLVFLFVTTSSTAEEGYYTIYYAWSDPPSTGCEGMSEGMRGWCEGMRGLNLLYLSWLPCEIMRGLNLLYLSWLPCEVMRGLNLLYLSWLPCEVRRGLNLLYFGLLPTWQAIVRGWCKGLGAQPPLSDQLAANPSYSSWYILN